MKVRDGETLKTALSGAQKYLSESGAEKGDAAVLLCAAAGLTKEAMYIRPETALTREQAGTFTRMLRERKRGMPVQYILGEAEFHGRRFAVSRGVFIPRPETEQLADIAIAHAKAFALKNGSARVLDLCAGSGAIAVTITSECPNAFVTAVDKSRKACDAIRYNAARLGAGDRITVLHGDLFAPVTGKFDVITCNPPYIMPEDMRTLQREVRKEPRRALYGGRDGLDYYRRLALEARGYLAQNGVLVMEMGYNQAEDIKRLFNDRYEVKIHEDFSSIPRIAEAILFSRVGQNACKNARVCSPP